MVLRKDALGQYGEEVAARYLSGLGMKVIERNWRCECGEIDIVASEGNALVVCEVKTRSSEAFGSPFEAITQRKLRRLRQLATKWLEARQVYAPTVRIDVVGIVQGAVGPPEINTFVGLSDRGCASTRSSGFRCCRIGYPRRG